MTVPTDPLYNQQWHLDMLGNLEKIWTDYTGRGVHVVVYDDGLQYTHPDIAPNYDSSQHFSFNGTTYDPMPIGADDNHGTSVSGLIGAAANNGRGGVGVAFGVTLTAVNYLSDLANAYDYTLQQTSPLYDAVMKWAANFDIMSNSWGVEPTFASYQNLNTLGGQSENDDRLLEWVAAHGRGGLGTIVVKAAGNETANDNGEGLDVSRFTVSVAAVERDGTVADYSNFGANILVAGPAAAYTTDRTGNAGYNNATDSDTVGVDYTSTFNGTSAATPVVSGVVALMLDANANLGWRDVNNILAMSAKHTGSAYGSAAEGFEQDYWTDMGGNHWNGGGNEYHASYGYGLVNAYGAVRMAEAWNTLYGPTALTSANEQHRIYGYTGPDLTIPDNGGATGDQNAAVHLNVGADFNIETVYITVTLTHTYLPDLQIGLVSPDGAGEFLFNKDGDQDTADGGWTWTFSVEALRGVNTRGQWTIEFHDAAGGDVGTVQDVQVEFFGRSASNNDVYHFTDDYRTMRNHDAYRRVLDDSNGGVDWLNFAAVTSNLTVNLASGGAVKFGASVLAHMGAGAAHFENLFAGDGVDRISGNALANRLIGARGNDVLNGFANNDRLEGGRGNDTLVGGYGNDAILGGAGADDMTGGAGRDVFVFSKGGANDWVLDFRNDVDTLQLSHTLWSGAKSVGQVLASFAHYQSGVGVILDFGHGNTLTLEDFTSVSQLSNDVSIT